MLIGQAIDYYIKNQRQMTESTLAQIGTLFKLWFKGQEHKISLLQEWNTTTFQDNFDQEKGYTHSLNSIIAKLNNLTYSLDSVYQTDQFMYTKLITAYEKDPAL
jgi:hypothetical protein